MRKYIFFLFSFFFFLTTLQGQDVNDIIKKVQKTYDKMDNFSAAFKQVDYFQLTGSAAETVGKIYVKDGEKYRFETEDQTVVTDGKVVWSYNSISQQVLIDNVREGSGALLPRDLLFKYPKNHYATLVGREEQDGRKVYILNLVPRENVHGYVKEVKIWVLDDKWHVIKLETTDLNDNQTVFEIKDIDAGTELSEGLFTFTADENTQVVDMR